MKAWRARQNEGRRILRRERREFGLCHNCGKPQCAGSTWYCRACLDRVNANTKAARLRAVAAGLCMQCRRERDPGDEDYCPECREATRRRSAEARRRLRVEAAREPPCDYCGERHTPSQRSALAARLLSRGAAPEVIREEWAHIWPRTPAGERLWYRDAARARARQAA